MIKVNYKGTTDGGSWQLAAASAYRGLRPATETTLLGAKYRLRREATPRVAGDRDYAVLQALARGRRCILDVGGGAQPDVTGHGRDDGRRRPHRRL